MNCVTSYATSTLLHRKLLARVITEFRCSYGRKPPA
jgi:hypothetical protein